MENFDKDYSDFENKYVSFLITTEASCKAIIVVYSTQGGPGQAGEQAKLYRARSQLYPKNACLVREMIFGSKNTFLKRLAVKVKSDPRLPP